jgi:photosystem II stability/assembly factor-like uncharacterized protein
VRNRRFACVSMLVVALSLGARAEGGACGRDVTPDPALFFANYSEGVVFRGENEVLAFAGRSGFHRSDNGGDRWKRAMNGFVDATGIEPYGSGLCQAPSAPGTVYSATSNAAAGRPVFRTDDLGKTWRRTIDAIDPAGFTEDCAVDPSNPEILYVLAQIFQPDSGAFIATLFKSTDGGRTFAAVPGFSALQLQGAFIVRVAPTSARTIFVANETGDENDGIYLSTDGGATFTRLAASPFVPFRIAPHPSVAGLLFVSALDGLFRSTDSGATFTLVVPGDVGAIAFDPSDPAAVFVTAGTGGILRSGNFGVTFTRLAGPTAAQVGPKGVGFVAVSGARRGRSHIYAGTERGPYRSDDGGSTFLPINDTYRGAAVNDLAIDARGRLMVGALHTVVLWRAQAAGHPRSDSFDAFGVRITTTQELVQNEWDGMAVAPSSLDADTVVVGALGNGVFSTADGGASWSKATFTPFEPFFGSFVRLAFAPGSAGRVYLAPRGSGLFRSNDAGRSFQLASLREPRIGAVAVDPRNPDVLYAGAFDNGRGLYKSTDGGTTLISLRVPGNFSTIAIDPRSPDTVYAASRGGGVLRSVDAGATWVSASAGLPPANEVLAVAVDPGIAGRLYAWVKAAGLFVSADGGASWKAVETDEAARRTGIEAGRASIAVDPVVAGRVYLGNSGVVQVDTLRDDAAAED